MFVTPPTRLGPGNTFGDMGDSHPEAAFAHVAKALSRFGLAYPHVVETRVKGNVSDDSRPTRFGNPKTDLLTRNLPR
jgi:hypothetical protein